METVLHLTDLHFGFRSNEPAEVAARQNCLDALLGYVSELEAEWKPTIICVTGDLVWRGTRDDYADAKTWLDKLLTTCELSSDRVVVCAGNHEVDRSIARKIPRPASATEADDALSPPLAEHFARVFSGFENFCTGAGIPPMTFGDLAHALVGQRKIGDISFVSLNSAWFSKDDTDEGKLWIGLPQLNYLQAKGQLPVLTFEGDEPITVGLMHHPPEWLHADERQATFNRPNTRDVLATRCHILLTGHTHGEVREPDQIARGALHFTGGATYAGGNYTNNFRLLRLTGPTILYRSFEYDPRSAKNEWRSFPARAIRLVPTSDKSSTESRPAESLPSHAVRNALRSAAERHWLRKSRLLRPSGPLPESIALDVAVRVSTQNERFDERGRLLRQQKAEHTMPLYEAARQSRKTLLLGDLGTGKSTLAGRLVVETLDRARDAVAILVPVKTLALPSALSVSVLIESVERYFATDVMPGGRLSLVSLLEQHVEVLIAFDGVDELPRDAAGHFLQLAAELTEHWPTIQVISTARPIELTGISFSDWRIVHTTTLDDEKREFFFREELIAEGTAPSVASQQAKALVRTLRDIPALDSMASSPLTVRLLYPYIQRDQSDGSLTLGDLLYELLFERVEGWTKRDDKPTTFEYLQEVLPSSEEKILLLARLGEMSAYGERLTIDAAIAILEDASEAFPNANKYRLAKDALSFFEWLGFVSKTDVLEFLLQPLAEMAAAIGLTRRWREFGGAEALPRSSHWRVVSFAAAVARRRGWLQTLRKPLLDFVERSLREDADNFAAACYVAAEAAEGTLAEKTVAALSRLPYRPLRILDNERRTSSRNIAKALWLAKDAGFDWFFSQYLDPRYPFQHAGSAIVTDVFKDWLILTGQNLPTRYAQRLRTLVMPYVAAGEAHFFGVLDFLSVLIPDAFTDEDRLWYQSSALEGEPFGHWALELLKRAAASAALRPKLDEVLSQRIGTGPRALSLWLQLNPDVEPPPAGIRCAFRALSAASKKESDTALADQVREMLGHDRWMRFARWYVLESDAAIATGAAIVLYESGETRLSQLDFALAGALHDGAQIAGAEKILSHLVEIHGEKGVRWIAARVGGGEDFNGAPSGLWRILLGKIETLSDGPNVLAQCVRNFGSFTLPRRPEIREALRAILNGPNWSEYRKALRGQLESIDPEARFGAAKVLVAIDPEGEGEALVAAVRGRHSERDLYEWEEFCLTLKFGAGPLAVLQRQLPSLDPESHGLALALLANSGWEIGQHGREELLHELLKLGNWTLAGSAFGQSLLSSESGFEYLQHQLDRPDSDIAARAAEKVLKLHRGRLTLASEAKCLAVRAAGRGWSSGIAELMARISKDSAFARALAQAASEIRGRGGSPQLAENVLHAIDGTSSWKDALWEMLCDDARGMGGSDADHVYGPILLEYGLTWPTQRKGIGDAALACFQDPRMANNRWIDSLQWLALIAHEFANVGHDTLRSALVRREPIYRAAAAALIARLGEVPEGVTFERAHRKRQRTSSKRYLPATGSRDLMETLSEYSRNSETLHPDTLAIFEEALLGPQLHEQNLRQIAEKGDPGILIAAALRQCYGLPPALAESLPLFDTWGRLWGNLQRSGEEVKLLRVWQAARLSALNEPGPAVTAYLAALDRKLADNATWLVPLAHEILRIRGSLLPDQIEPVFLDYARHATFLHDSVFKELVAWFSGELDGATRTAVVAASRLSLAKLDETSWTLSSGERANVWALLLFPVLCWALTGESDDQADSVFLRGLQSVLEQGEQSSSRPRQINIVKQVLTDLEPLLKMVPDAIFRTVLQSGLATPSPVLRIFCRLIASLAHLPGERR